MKSESKKGKVFLLDTMVLINFAERCESHDLFELFKKIGFGFQIVEQVEIEFRNGMKPIGKSRFEKYIENGTIEIIPNKNIEIDLNRMSYFLSQSFGKGELFSSLYTITQKIDFVSDEKRVHDVFEKKLKTGVFRTSDLLDILVEYKVIGKNQKIEILEELVKKGFWLKDKEI